jgi:protein phosphatase
MQKAANSPEMRGMGTTVTLAFVRGTYVIIAHVGDSRAYLVDGDDHHITQITSDHSFVEALLAAGHITPEQADEHPMRNVLYRALGQAEDIDVDMYYKRLHIGDRLVLCSDGLTRHVKPEEIAQLALADPNPDVASQKLIDLANERGGEDNVSVIVISVEQSTPAANPETEAVLLNETDDDQTLVLKGRVPPRTTMPNPEDLPSALKTDTVETSPAVESFTLQPIPITPINPLDPLVDEKMQAERLKDSPEPDPDSLFPDEEITQEYEPLSDETIDRALSTRPDGLPIVEIEVVPPRVPQESQMEGRDTLLPDQ